MKKTIALLIITSFSAHIYAADQLSKRVSCLASKFASARTPNVSSLREGEFWSCSGVKIQKNAQGERVLESVDDVWYYNFKMVVRVNEHGRHWIEFDNTSYTGENYMPLRMVDNRGNTKMIKGLFSFMGWGRDTMWSNVIRQDGKGRLYSEFAVGSRDAKSRNYLLAHEDAPNSVTSYGSERRVNQLLVCTPVDSEIIRPCL